MDSLDSSRLKLANYIISLAPTRAIAISRFEDLYYSSGLPPEIDRLLPYVRIRRSAAGHLPSKAMLERILNDTFGAVADERRARASELFEAGLSRQKVAEEMDISVTTVGRLFRKQWSQSTRRAECYGKPASPDG